MGLISGISNAVAGRKQRKMSKKALKEYLASMEQLGDVPEYQGPDAFLTLDAAQMGPIERAEAASYDAFLTDGVGYDATTGEAALMGPIERADATGYDPTQASFADATGARSYADTLYGGYDPVDARDAAFASLQQQAADAVNMAGGRRADQQRAVERIVAQGVPQIEGQYADRAQQMALARGGAAENVAGLQSQFGLSNADILNAAERFGADAVNRAFLTNAAAANQAGQFNAGNRQAMNLANLGALNRAAEFTAGNQQAANMANQAAQNQAARFGAGNLQQVNLTNAQAANQANQYNTGLRQQTGVFNTQGQNQFNQTQADRAFTSDQYGYGQNLSNVQNVYNARLGNAMRQSQGIQMIGSGVGDAVNTAAQAALLGAALPAGGNMIGAQMAAFGSPVPTPGAGAGGGQ